MKELDFELPEFNERLRRARAALADCGIDVMLVHDPANIYWLTGWRGKAYQSYQVLLLPLDERPLVLITRTSDVDEVVFTSIVDDVHGWRPEAGNDPFALLGNLLGKDGLLKKRVGYDLPLFYLSVPQYFRLMATLAESRTSDMTGVIDVLRRTRSPTEILYTRRASAINDAGVAAGSAVLAAGKTELAVAGAMHEAMMSAGGQSPASPMNFASGYRAMFSHGFPSEKVIEHGDIIQAEWGANYRGYHCTIGRMWSVGPTSDRVQELYRAIRDACDSVIEATRPGVRMCELEWAAKKALGPSLEPYVTHKVGYLVKFGFPPAWGNFPALAPDEQTVLEEGMMFSVEPPLFIPHEKLGVRIIDNVLVTSGGGELMSKTAREIVVV